MSTERIKATCVVEMQIECADVWSADTTMAQIIKQAESSARDRINRIFLEAGSNDDQLAVQRKGAVGISLVGIKRITTQAIVDK